MKHRIHIHTHMKKTQTPALSFASSSCVCERVFCALLHQYHGSSTTSPSVYTINCVIEVPLKLEKERCTVKAITLTRRDFTRPRASFFFFLVPSGVRFPARNDGVVRPVCAGSLLVPPGAVFPASLMVRFVVSLFLNLFACAVERSKSPVAFGYTYTREKADTHE